MNIAAIFNKLSKFNNSKIGVITGLVLGTAMTSMGAVFIINSITRRDLFPIVSSFIVLGIGISAIVVEIYRARKLKEKKQ